MGWDLKSNDSNLYRKRYEHTNFPSAGNFQSCGIASPQKEKRIQKEKDKSFQSWFGSMILLRDLQIVSLR
jgi:hypothetical protein